MATAVIMPRQGQSVESCIITEWLKEKGDKVQVGDVLFTYETDKASFEEEAKVEGTFLGKFFEIDDDVPVLTNVCVIGEEGEDISEFRPDGDQESEEKENVKEEKAEVTEEVAQVKPVVKREDGDMIKISPRARNLAEKSGVDYSQAQGTGPENRIIERDINNLIENGSVVTKAAKDKYTEGDYQGITGTGLGGRITTGDLEGGRETVPSSKEEVAYEDKKLSNIRKVIAKSMHKSLSTTAQLTLNSSFDATDILAFRKKIKETKEALGLANITLNDIILYAVAKTLLNHPELNAHFFEDKIRLFKNVHLGVAVDTERGLMVPTVFNANLKSLDQMSKELKTIIEDCQKGTINPDYLQGASFTVTNLGTLGIESFTPVLNPPQTGILGVNTIVQKAKEINGEYQYYPAMGLSLTFDHRALDGAPAARFLQDLVNNLENFTVLMAK